MVNKLAYLLPVFLLTGCGTDNNPLLEIPMDQLEAPLEQANVRKYYDCAQFFIATQQSAKAKEPTHCSDFVDQALTALHTTGLTDVDEDDLKDPNFWAAWTPYYQAKINKSFMRYK